MLLRTGGCGTLPVDDDRRNARTDAGQNYCEYWKITRYGGLGSRWKTPVDVRVVAATQQDPEQTVSRAHLRQALISSGLFFIFHLPPCATIARHSAADGSSHCLIIFCGNHRR